jgi:hypothetical protein
MAQNEVSARSHRRQLLLLLVFAVWPISAASGQQQQQRDDQRQSPGYAFVSPNTRENLTLEEAQAGLNSDEEKRLVAEAHRVACRLRESLNVDKAVGSWTDGAEHSSIMRIHTSESSLRYASSWLGKFARQKAILYFRQRPEGIGRMYVLYLPLKSESPKRQDMASISTELEANGVANRTLVPQRQRLLVYVVDLKNELRSKVLASARRLKARLSAIKGDGEFIGDDDRDKAQQIFDQEIVRYESAHPRVRRACRRKIVRKTAGLLLRNAKLCDVRNS